MELSDIPQDDLMDLVDMTTKMENFISKIIQENEVTLAVAALMTASINCMLSSCKTLDEFISYRNVFMDVIDNAIGNMRIEKP